MFGYDLKLTGKNGENFALIFWSIITKTDIICNMLVFLKVILQSHGKSYYKMYESVKHSLSSYYTDSADVLLNAVQKQF